MRVQCSATGRFAQNESKIRESNESLKGCGCRTDRELALHCATTDSISSHFKRLREATVKDGFEASTDCRPVAGVALVGGNSAVAKLRHVSNRYRATVPPERLTRPYRGPACARFAWVGRWRPHQRASLGAGINPRRHGPPASAPAGISSAADLP